jgi:AcrR family transcriptional regulator
MIKKDTGVSTADSPATHRHGLKQERAVRTYAQILTTAADIFAAKGFSEVTLADIAERAGVTKGAIYFHFANKEAIAVAVSEEYYARLRAVAARVRQMGVAPLDTAAQFLTQMAVSLRDDSVFQAAVRLHTENALTGTSSPTPFVSYIEMLSGLLREARDKGDLVPGRDPDAMARVLVAAFFGAQHISWALHGRADIIERIQEVIDLAVPERPNLLLGTHSSRAGARG